MTARRVTWRGRKPVLCASAGVALAVLAGAALPGALGAAASASTDKAAIGSTPVTLGAAPLGMDVAPWDTLYSSPATLNKMQSYLKAAGIGQIHYGGGGTADQYDWQTNTEDNNPSDCGDAPTAAELSLPCDPTPDSLDFADASADARALGAQTYVTVNYGSGTPAMAAAWVTKAEATAGQGVAEWSIGNESYGCWEYDTWLTGAPLDDADYAANVQATCPMNIYGQAAGLQDVANSYAENALPYMQQMTAADPSIKIGVPYAFDFHVGGAAVGNNQEWNNTVLQADGQYISFVEAHFYPFSFGGDVSYKANPSAQAVIQSVEQIPNDYAAIQSTLAANNSTAKVVIGETGVSYLPTNVPCIPAGALFSAGDALEWLASGVQTIDWWPMETGDNTGSACNVPDEAMFTGNGTPDTMYTGYLLASQLAKPNAQLSSLAVDNLSDPGNTNNAIGFQSKLPNGQVAVALINTNTTYAQKVSVATSLTGNLTTESYIAADQNKVTATSPAPTKIVTGTTTSGAIAGSITLPPESIVVLKSSLPSKVTLGAPSSVRAGTRLTVRGALTLDGAAAPAGTVVKVYRRTAGSNVNQATLTTTTRAGGTFAVIDLPPAHGNYDYVASYPGSSVYEWGSSPLALVHVVAVKPPLRLAVSARSVRPGGKVTLTATLGAWHANRTLTIYAQPKGGAKRVIKRATVNSRGQVSVVYTVKANTTFTVAFTGDAWFTSAVAATSVTG